MSKASNTPAMGRAELRVVACVDLGNMDERGMDDIAAFDARFTRDLELPAAARRLLAECQVSGMPVTQGSTTLRTARRTGRKFVSHVRAEALREWRDQVAWTARLVNPGVATHDGPARLEAIFYLARPRTVSRSRILPLTRPDLDKLLRAVGDALSAEGARFLSEDGRIVEVAVSKRYVESCPGVEEPGVALRLYALDPLALDDVAGLPELSAADEVLVARQAVRAADAMVAFWHSEVMGAEPGTALYEAARMALEQAGARYQDAVDALAQLDWQEVAQ